MSGHAVHGTVHGSLHGAVAAPTVRRAPMTGDAMASRDEAVRRRVRPLRRFEDRLIVRLARPLALALCIVGLPTALGVWVSTSPLFALAEVMVEPAQAGSASGPAAGRVGDAWVLATLQPYRGANLPWLSLAELEGKLRRHPWVAAVAVRKELPSRLCVRVWEKRAVAIYRHDGGPLGSFASEVDHDAGGLAAGLYYLDARGHAIARYASDLGGDDLVVISGRGPSGDLRVAVEMAREIELVAPGWAPGLSEVEMLSDKDFRVWTSDLDFPLLVRAGTLASGSRRLEALLPQIAARFDRLGAVDLRFSRRIILQPGRGTALASLSGTAERGRSG